jgi:hypothetical protein
MAIIPAAEKVFMVSNSTNTTYSGSAALKAMQQWYTMEDVTNTVRPYKVYSALLNQSGTSAPTAVVNENTIGTMTITRNNTGVYYFVSPEFNSYDDYGKVLCFISNGSADGSTGVLSSVNGQYVPPINGIQVVSKIASTLTPTDNAIQGCSIEIRLYN